MSNRTNLSKSYNYTVTAASDNSAYLWSGHGLEDAPNPTIYIRSDDDITITNASGGHVMNLSSDDVSWGMTESNGQIVLISDANLLGEGSYTYVCSSHPAMTGKIKVSNAVVHGGPEDGYGTGLLPGNNLGGARASVSVDQIRTKINEIITKGGVGGTGGGSISVSQNAPGSPSDGDLWWDSDTASLYVYFEDRDAWIQTNGAVGGGANFSTGWVNTDGTTAVANGAKMQFDHNLGTTDVIVEVWAADDINGTNNNRLSYSNHDSGATIRYGAAVHGVTSNTIGVVLGSYGYFDEQGDLSQAPTGVHQFESGGVRKYIKVVVSAGGGGGGASGGGDASIEVSATAPDPAEDGDLWFNTTQAELYVYVDAESAWIQTNGGGGGGGGLTIESELRRDSTGDSSASLSLWTTIGYGGQFGNRSPTFTNDGSGPRQVYFRMRAPATLTTQWSGEFTVKINGQTSQVIQQNGDSYSKNETAFTTFWVSPGDEYYIDKVGLPGELFWGETTFAGGGTGTRAYVAFDGTAADLTGSITNSFNVSSITDNSTGDYTVAFTTLVANQVISVACNFDSLNAPMDPSYEILNSNQVKIKIGESESSWPSYAADPSHVSLIVF